MGKENDKFKSNQNKTIQKKDYFFNALYVNC